MKWSRVEWSHCVDKSNSIGSSWKMTCMVINIDYDNNNLYYVDDNVNVLGKKHWQQNKKQKTNKYIKKENKTKTNKWITYFVIVIETIPLRIMTNRSLFFCLHLYHCLWIFFLFIEKLLQWSSNAMQNPTYSVWINNWNIVYNKISSMIFYSFTTKKMGNMITQILANFENFIVI